MNKFEYIESSRLILRPLNIPDAPSLFKYRSNKFTNQYQGWIPEKLEDVNDFIENKIAKEFNQIGSWFQIAIVLKESNELIGDLGLHFLENDMVEIGCTIAQENQGNSFATEALKLTIEHLFSQFNKHKIIGSVDPRNTASIAMLHKLGFQKEAFHPKSFLLRGEWVDDLVFVLFNDHLDI